MVEKVAAFAIWLRDRLTSKIAVIAIIALLAAGDLRAQQPPSATLNESPDKRWSFSAAASIYVLPDMEYVQPTIIANRNWLHLEARYNYESLDTGSAWFGVNFAGGKTVEWEFIPLLGGVFGDTTGVAPGFKGSLAWWKLEFYTENEYVADTSNHSDSFFYDWSELSVTPAERLRFGLVTQRTRAYASDRDVQRGLLAGVSFKRMNFTSYFFNPDTDKPSFVFAAEFKF